MRSDKTHMAVVLAIILPSFSIHIQPDHPKLDAATMSAIMEKPAVIEVDDGRHHTERDVINHIDAIAMAPGTTIESFAHLDQKKILRKMDVRLIPMLAILYLLSFLDRGNIGNAKIEGLQEDLKMTSDQYNLCLTVFFFTYAAFEVPSNLLLKRLRPSRWLPSIMVAWGTVVTLMGIVQNFQGLLSTRIFLGVAEAGLYPGCAYYLTMWYCRREIQLRQAMFFSAASIAGAFSGLLAYAIAKLDGLGGLEGWRWIFILEGLATVVVAVLSFFILHDFPETATFLTEEERAFVIFRLKYQGHIDATDECVQVAQAEEFDWKYVKAAFKDWQIWVNIFVYWGIVCPLYGVALFLPTIIKGLGYTSSTAQLLTVPIYITAAILAVVIAYFSDRVGKRSPFVITCMFAILIGFVLCISTSNPGVVYAGVFIATAGIYSSFAGNIAWLSNNLAGGYKRSAGMAIQIGLGNLGGAFASNFYRQKDSPRYILGHALELGFTSIGIIAAFIMVLGYTRINKKRAKSVKEGGHTQFTPEELSAQGDKAVTYRYVY
ncbi:MFS general substrate transporter [Xylariaceae sp. FL1651]|nr:MFS general substrate transporter [Xylariaceae sp. FL1651]